MNNELSHAQEAALRRFGKKIRRAAPGVNSGGGRSSRRLPGQVSYDRECNAFLVVHIYIEKGMAGHRPALRKMMNRIAYVQSNLSKPYRINCYAFGSSQGLESCDNPTIIRLPGTTMKVAHVLGRLSGDSPPSLPVVFADVGRRIKRGDLTVIICRKRRGVHVAEKAQTQLKRCRRTLFWLYLEDEECLFETERQRIARSAGT